MLNELVTTLGYDAEICLTDYWPRAVCNCVCGTQPVSHDHRRIAVVCPYMQLQTALSFRTNMSARGTEKSLAALNNEPSQTDELGDISDVFRR